MTSDNEFGQGPGEDSPGGPGPGSEAPRVPDSEARPSLESEEEVLRRLLQDSVQDVRPSPAALDHLRRAIPARRARRRQALVGAVASVLLVGTAVPALVHTAGSSDTPSNAARGTHPTIDQQGDQGDPARRRTPAPKDRPSDRATGRGEGHSDPDPGQSRKPSREVTPDRPPPRNDDDGETVSAGPAACAADQLGNSTVEVGEPDGEGKRYGTFWVMNVSSESCLLDAPGTVQAVAQGSADPARVLTSPHSEGGPAAGLPLVSDEQIVLAPGTSFSVRFGWVPESGTTGCPTTSVPPDGQAADGSGEGEDPGGDPPPDPPAGSVAITYTPAGGGSSATGTVNDACAGTVYYTPPIAAA
ncbi:hypothetical protein AQ490_06360 [Wenjunlia vitaminophila]|uniref:DUF4232 domain-containing protein n=1 Tax=Wenjunlia vitaminophila TaxID=76728 RepID=A0A0T6LN27_WENVI|nr:hypothetical protein [Wenjunlia vitaminophila]KRV47517.1 hypothetical protein AQ490_06360 [Wenjunlia vitaminophila]